MNDTAGANAGDRQHRATPPDRENVARDERHVGARQNGQKRRDADERVQPRINAHGRTGPDAAAFGRFAAR